MADLLILHNKGCRSSQAAVDLAAQLGLDAEVELYLQTKPDAQRLRALVAILEDPPADLVRKDARFAKLGLRAEDYTSAEAVIELLAAQPALLQRPIVVRGDRAVIGRPLSKLKVWLGEA